MRKGASLISNDRANINSTCTATRKLTQRDTWMVLCHKSQLTFYSTRNSLHSCLIRVGFSVACRKEPPGYSCAPSSRVAFMMYRTHSTLFLYLPHHSPAACPKPGTSSVGCPSVSTAGKLGSYPSLCSQEQPCVPAEQPYVTEQVYTKELLFCFVFAKH